MAIKPYPCPGCGALNSPYAKYCSGCGIKINAPKMDFMETVDEPHKTLCVKYIVHKRLTEYISNDDVKKMVEERIADEMAKKLISDKMIKIESKYDACLDSMVYLGSLDIIPPHEN